MTKKSPANARADALPGGARPARPPEELVQVAAHIAAGRYGVAEGLCRNYLKENPADVSAIRMLGEIGLELGALVDAQNLLERCLELAPDYAAARFSYASVLYKRHRNTEALEQLDLLLSGDPANAAWLTMKAANLVEVSRHREAITLFEQTLANQPAQKQAQLSYGHALRAVGRQTAAIEAYRGCIEAFPATGEAYWSLANLKTYIFSDADIEQMEQSLRNQDIEYRDYYHLLFALGKAREDRGEAAAAMACYVKGNSVRRKGVPWDADAFHRDCAELRQFFSAELFSDRQGQGCPAEDPIFIVGLPRAGSTLLEQILSSHSQVEGTAELANIIALARRIAGKKRRDDPSQYPAALAGMTPGQLQALGQEYLDGTRAQRRTGKPRFIDKMPNNFSHVGLIRLILPNARIIDARRNPMDCCFSGYKQLFASGQGFTYSLQGIGRYYRDYVETMEHWDRVLPGFVLRVNYEDVVANTELEVRRVLDFCGLPFERECLEFHTTRRAVRTASSEQVRQPIYQSGIGQWRSFEPWLGTLKDALGPLLDDNTNSTVKPVSGMSA